VDLKLLRLAGHVADEDSVSTHCVVLCSVLVSVYV
jgi:hypothetical protein